MICRLIFIHQGEEVFAVDGEPIPSVNSLVTFTRYDIYDYKKTQSRSFIVNNLHYIFERGHSQIVSGCIEHLEVRVHLRRLFNYAEMGNIGEPTGYSYVKNEPWRDEIEELKSKPTNIATNE